MNDIEKLRECGKLQLSEIEMLESMFPGSSEFVIESDGLRELKEFVNGSNVIPSVTEYTVNLKIAKATISMNTVISPLYPDEAAEIYVRSSLLSRNQQKSLNSSLSIYLKSFEKGDLVVGLSILWLQDNSQQFFTDETDAPQLEENKSDTNDLIFNRAWIYSHHIYSKVKRKDIKDLADEYKLTGFCLPGKPGLICVEGTSDNVKQWWQTVRSWNWQKILCKKMEEETLCSSLDITKHHRFHNFQELGSDSNIRIKCNGYHVDMGDLYRYLSDHNSSYIFEEYFGVTGK